MTEDLNFDKPHSSEIQLLSSNCQFFSHKILSFHLLPLPGKFQSIHTNKIKILLHFDQALTNLALSNLFPHTFYIYSCNTSTSLILKVNSVDSMLVFQAPQYTQPAQQALRAPFFSCAHYFQAPATQATVHMKGKTVVSRSQFQTILASKETYREQSLSRYMLQCIDEQLLSVSTDLACN